MTVLAAPLMLVAGQAEAEVDVYVTPGEHTVNGRLWNTACEPYSQTTRCRTEIQATQVTQVNGRFVQKTGWVFNNLTYAASARSLWNTNPLAANGVDGGKVAWTATDGRKWRTECDTAVTGRNGCRSYIEARVVESYTTSSGSRGFRWVTKWVFNNMVRFTPGSGTPVTYPTAAPMKSAPAFLQGRRHFTLGNLITQTNAGAQAKGIGRLSNIELDPGGRLGTFRESYWAYTFDMAVEKDYAQFRAPIPDPPTGCLSSKQDSSDRSLLSLPQLPAGDCDVRTARTFLGKPTVRTGTYGAIPGSDGNRIKLYWNNSPITETYINVTPQGQSFSELRLTGHSHPNAVNAIGFMFGSTSPRGTGRSLAPEISRLPWKPPNSVDPAQVSQSLFPFNAGGADKTLWTQTVGSPAVLSSRQSFRFQDYIATGGGCIVTPPAVRGRVAYGWHSYMCPLPSEGKMVWHHMVSSLVAEGHGLCPAYVAGTSLVEHRKRCEAASPATVSYSLPARAGGHVYEALQVVDDANRLVAIVGLESSLYSHKASSQSQLGLFATITGN
ncbi:hypothetical protein LKO27_11275 [Tessaracoccus sp. OS52]|uniref:hypothetical protein n=1 Tax=Tessaracoccus sp. OS52 TaxID=2886691 RepID=UPI001D105CBB|nr:hypothetical protein [Tessaracoccus sp. OS52]MCC2593987.1 hypothetical protein [Tessaracoccus sp. OS52]